MIPCYSMTDYVSTVEYPRKINLHDAFFEAETEVSFEDESQYETVKWKSVWDRAFRLKPYGSQTLVRQKTVRGENTLSMYDFEFGATDVIFTLLFISLCCIWHILLYVASLFSHLHSEFADTNTCVHERSMEIWEILVARFMLIPSFYYLGFYVYTNLRGFRGWKLWLRITVIWIANAILNQLYHSMWLL